ncbi:MAG: DUF4129 domain-containing protein [Tannerella sp.]|nr:DUF4129 domain-containing protein [Tannerella sp.]
MTGYNPMVHPLDTILCDSAKIAGYQADKRFDYNSRLAVPDIHLTEMFRQWLSRLLNRFFDNEVAGGIVEWGLILFFVAVVLFVVYFVYKKRPELFIREKRKPLPCEIEEENIYTIDFDKELSAAVATSDFRMAIRVLYLQTLRFVADKQWIDWQIYKTPTEYTCELKPAGLKATFRDLTNRFLQVRYGNFKATRDLFDTMHGLQDELRKGDGDEEAGE